MKVLCWFNVTTVPKASGLLAEKEKRKDFAVRYFAPGHKFTTDQNRKVKAPSQPISYPIKLINTFLLQSQLVAANYKKEMLTLVGIPALSAFLNPSTPTLLEITRTICAKLVSFFVLLMRASRFVPGREKITHGY